MSSDESDVFPSTGGVAFYSAKGSDDTSLESEVLAQIAGAKLAVASKKKHKSQKGKTAIKAPKKKPTNKNSSVTIKAGTSSSRLRSAAHGVAEHLLGAKVFMKVSCDTKHATDWKAEKFLDGVNIVFEEIVATTNKMNQSKPDFIPIKAGCGADSLHNCWQQ
jgi:hypothetical protein